MQWKREKYGKTGEVSFSETEWNSLLGAVDSIEDELLLQFTVSTGLRREDVVSVLIENIDFDKETLTYYERKKRRTREIPLQIKVLKLIRQYLNVVKRRYGKLFDFSGRTAYNKLNRCCEKAGISKRPFHSLRATCVKFCIKSKWSLLEIAKLTGDEVETIETHYAVPSKGDMNEVAKNKPTV